MTSTLKSKIEYYLNSSARGAIIITALILFSLALIILKTEYPNSQSLKVGIDIIGIVFVIEYILRVWIADLTYSESRRPRLKYIFSFNGVVDFLAALPIFIGFLTQNVTAVRTLRLVRLAQLFKLKFIRDATRDVLNAFKQSWNDLAFTTLISVTFILIGATAMYVVERDVQPEAFGSIPRAMWWAVATLTTVGYGDVYPVTVAGKIVASFLAIVGIAAVAMPAGILASAFSQGRNSE